MGKFGMITWKYKYYVNGNSNWEITRLIYFQCLMETKIATPELTLNKQNFSSLRLLNGCQLITFK
jgi:hypothetical protein